MNDFTKRGTILRSKKKNRNIEDDPGRELSCPLSRLQSQGYWQIRRNLLTRNWNATTNGRVGTRCCVLNSDIWNRGSNHSISNRLVEMLCPLKRSDSMFAVEAKFRTHWAPARLYGIPKIGYSWLLLVFGVKQFTKQIGLINFLIGQLGFVLAPYFFQDRLSFLCRTSVEILPNMPRET